MSCPSAITVPELGVTMPQTMLMRVVLPAPFGPSSAKISPFRISRLMLLRAGAPDAYVLVRLAMETTGVIGTTLAHGSPTRAPGETVCASADDSADRVP